MSDLISRSELILRLSDYALQESPNDNESTGEQRISKMIYDAIQNCIACVKEQPTAYNVDKVVEELKEIQFSAEIEEPIQAETNVTELFEAQVVLLDDAIEIVKQGGVNIRKDCEYRHDNGNCLKVGGFCTAVDNKHCEKLKQGGVADDVCEWKSDCHLENDNPSEWLICPHNPKRIFSKDIKYCPYCGKKIKVVG